MFVVIGTVTADLLVTSETSPLSLSGDGFRSSNLVFTENPVTLSMGGNGGNSAYVLAGLGVPTALCGAIGRDLLGDALVGWLSERKIDLSGLHRSATHATSSSTVIMSAADNQVVYHHLGSSTQANYAAMPEMLFKSADVLLASSYPILPQMRAGGFAQALIQVKKSGGITALDIGPAIGEPVTLEEIIPLLPSLDYFIANTHELKSLTGKEDWQEAADILLEANAGQLVIKQGADGSAVWTRSDRLFVPGFKVDAKASVGAGDSFNVGFLWAVKQGRPLDEALRFGNAVAALVVSSPTGVLGSPSLEEVEALLMALD